jgi:HSP20 family protein
MSEKTKTATRAMEMQPRRWDPFGMLTEMEAEMERLLGRVPRRLVPTSGVWVPRVDAYEKDGALIVEAELPGIKKEDVEVAIEDGDLVIRGERKSEAKVEEQDYYRMERSYGRFYRRLPLPEGVDANKIEAHFADGVLTLRVPKPVAARPQPTKIPIK